MANNSALEISRNVKNEIIKNDEMSEEETFTRLLQMIIELELEPGGMVSENTLIEMLNTNRSSLRSVIDRLKQLDLVTVIPRAGIVINMPDFLEIQKVFEARMCIETYILRLAAIRTSEEEIQDLIQRNQEIKSTAETALSDNSDVSTLFHFIELDRALHTKAAELCKNPILQKFMFSILITNSHIWNWFFRRSASDIQHGLFIPHDEIVEAIANRDPDAAELAIKKHLERSWAILQQSFAAVPGTKEAGIE